MPFTRAELVARVARRVDDNPFTDSVAAAVTTTTATSLTAQAATYAQYEEGQTLDFLDDGSFEAMVVAAIPGTPTLTVRRAHRGTTAATHLVNAVFRKDPGFLSQTISEAVDEAISGLWPDVYQPQVSTYTVSATPDYWYEVTADTEDVIGAYQLSGTPQRRYELDPGQMHLVHPGFSSTEKAVGLTGASTANGSLYIITIRRISVGDLTTPQADLVSYAAARVLFEQTINRATTESDPSVTDAFQKLSLFRREETRLRMIEKARLQAYLPRRDRLIYAPMRHYYEDAGFGHVPWH